MNSGDTERLAVPVPHVTLVVVLLKKPRTSSDMEIVLDISIHVCIIQIIPIKHQSLTKYEIEVEKNRTSFLFLHKETIIFFIIPHIIKNQLYWLKDNHMTYLLLIAANGEEVYTSIE